MTIKQYVKPFVPTFMRKHARRGVDTIERTLARHTGLLPDFIIIGAQKCGTTSLYNYLIRHPSINTASTKEVGYFDRYYDKGIKWYRSNFPTSIRKKYEKVFHHREIITGEASTGYILYPFALMRIAKTTPNARLILMLRDPVDRAYSHYHHSVRIGTETLPFEEAIEMEQERIGADIQRIRVDENYYSRDIDHYAYLNTGIYIDQVTTLMSLFPPEQVLILKSEEFYANTRKVFSQVLNFLDMPPLELGNPKKFNPGAYKEMDTKVRNRLVNFFEPYNQRLYEFLGTGCIAPW